MDCKSKTFLKMKVNARISDVFLKIIYDIPYPAFKEGKSNCIVPSRTTLMSYEEFYNIVYRCVLEYIPKNNESLLGMVLNKFPNAIKNIKAINKNKVIIEKQRMILDKYFDVHGDMNLRDKIYELKAEVDKLLEQGEIEYLDPILNSFEERIRHEFLEDMKELSRLLEKH